MGLVESITEYYPDGDWQGCMFYFILDVFCDVSHGKLRQVSAILKAIYAQESRQVGSGWVVI